MFPLLFVSRQPENVCVCVCSEPEVVKYLRNVYLVIALAIISTAAGAYFPIFEGIYVSLIRNCLRYDSNLYQSCSVNTQSSAIRRTMKTLRALTQRVQTTDKAAVTLTLTVMQRDSDHQNLISSC